MLNLLNPNKNKTKCYHMWEYLNVFIWIHNVILKQFYWLPSIPPTFPKLPLATTVLKMSYVFFNLAIF